MSAILVILVALPLVAAAASAAGSHSLGDRAGRVGAAAAAAGFGLAVALTVRVIALGPVSAVLTDGSGRATFGLFADRLSVVMLLLVLGVSTVVQLFASRYLSGDPRQARLIAACGVTTTAVCAVVCAATLGVLVGAWLASGLGLLALLAHRRDLAAGRLGVRRAAFAFAVGDGMLVAGAVLVWSSVGDLDLRHLGDAATVLRAHHLLGTISVGALFSCTIVVAALGRSAQLPLQRWLPATLAAPTPVSAFLHAGLVNAGGFLLVRLSAVFGLTPVAPYLAFALGTATALYGTVLMLAKPDVKGGLAHSTMGQMGFMVMACALGAPAAAIFHLVGHGMYKATLFLGADSVVHNDKRRAIVPDPAPAGVRWPRAARAAVAALVPAAALALALATFASAALHHGGAAVLIAFAWATAATAAWGWLSSTPGRAAVGLAGLAGVCLLYAGLIAGAGTFLAPAIVAAAHPVTPWLGVVPAAAVVLGLAAVGAVEDRRSSLYVRALDAGYVAGARETARRAQVAAPITFPVPVPLPREQVPA